MIHVDVVPLICDCPRAFYCSTTFGAFDCCYVPVVTLITIRSLTFVVTPLRSFFHLYTITRTTPTHHYRCYHYLTHSRGVPHTRLPTVPHRVTFYCDFTFVTRYRTLPRFLPPLVTLRYALPTVLHLRTLPVTHTVDYRTFPHCVALPRSTPHLALTQPRYPRIILIYDSTDIRLIFTRLLRHTRRLSRFRSTFVWFVTTVYLHFALRCGLPHGCVVRFRFGWIGLPLRFVPAHATHLLRTHARVRLLVPTRYRALSSPFWVIFTQFFCPTGWLLYTHLPHGYAAPAVTFTFHCVTFVATTAHTHYAHTTRCDLIPLCRLILLPLPYGFVLLCLLYTTPFTVPPIYVAVPSLIIYVRFALIVTCVYPHLRYRSPVRYRYTPATHTTPIYADFADLFLHCYPLCRLPLLPLPTRHSTLRCSTITLRLPFILTVYPTHVRC